MANEAVLLREIAPPISYTVADGTGIEKGTVLKLSDPNTAAASTATNDIVAGIAAQEKIASNGQTKLAVYDKGDFKMTASGTITVGQPLGITYANQVYALTAGSLSGNVILGFALEAASDTETFRVRLQPTSMVDTRD